MEEKKIKKTRRLCNCGGDIILVSTTHTMPTDAVPRQRIYGPFSNKKPPSVKEVKTECYCDSCGSLYNASIVKKNKK